MNSVFRNLINAAFAKTKSPQKENSANYNGSAFNPAPSYWALIPVRADLGGQKQNRDEMVSQFINKNKQL